ncbi:nucleotide pyrophosphohydrolase [Candidatus Woesearchaeota archaeon]|nr:nucleotide pyrophosphohydrolase [Candidatus Woesearchaeota archaeon]
MDHSTKIQELKEKIKQFCEDRDWDQYHGAKELSIGVITEASELLEHFRFKSEKEIEEFFKDNNKKEKISEEVADVLYFILRFAQRYDIDLATVLNKKMEKNEQKYPLEKSKGSNKKYTEL